MNTVDHVTVPGEGWGVLVGSSRYQGGACVHLGLRGVRAVHQPEKRRHCAQGGGLFPCHMDRQQRFTCACFCRTFPCNCCNSCAVTVVFLSPMFGFGVKIYASVLITRCLREMSREAACGNVIYTNHNHCSHPTINDKSQNARVNLTLLETEILMSRHQ